MSPELEVLDQLLGGDLPLNVITGLFSDPEHCRLAIGAMLSDGEIRILDSTKQPILFWRYHELESERSFWDEGTPYLVSITETGVRRIG